MVFDQYQRYKNAQIIINKMRKEGEKFTVLEVGANEHKNLEKFLPDDKIIYMDIHLSEERMKDEQYILGDATNMDFVDDSFDIIVALDVYEHIPEEKRRAFINEISRVSKIGFVICAPFDNENGAVGAAEKRMSEAYRVMYGIPHPWLIEHIENGLPSFANTEKLLKECNVNHIIFNHGDLTIWEKMMYMQIMADSDKNLASYFDTVSDYYINNIFSVDYSDNAYRKFIVGDKENREIDIEAEYSDMSDKLCEIENTYHTLFEMTRNKNGCNQLEVKLNQLEGYLTQNANRCVQIHGEKFDGTLVNNLYERQVKDNMICIDYSVEDVSKLKAIYIEPIREYALMQVNLVEFVDCDENRKKLTDEELKDCIKNMTPVIENYYLIGMPIPRVNLQSINGIKKVRFNASVAYLDEVTYKILLMLAGEIEDTCDEKNKEIADFEQKSTNLQRRYDCEHRNVEKLLQVVEQLRIEKDAFLNSKAWKATAPARFIGDVFSQNLIGRAIQCVKDNGLEYTIDLYKSGGYNKSPIEDNLRLEEEVLWENGKAEKKNICQYLDLDEKERQRQENYKFDEEIKFSILVPLYNTPENFLREMIESVLYQTYKNWELCLADGSDEEHAFVNTICQEYCKSDSRIQYKKLAKNGGISENTNACIEMASGNYISLFDHDDILHPAVLFETAVAISTEKADYVYTDEATFEGTDITKIITRHCKPDFAIDNLRANNYICHFSTFKRNLLDKAGWFRKEYDGSQDHDIILRLTEKAQKVYHIPKILYYWRSHPNSVALDINSKTYAIEAARKSVYSHLERCGLKGEVLGTVAFPTIFHIRYEIIGNPLVSIIIPNKDHGKDLLTCVASILTKSSYKNYEIIIVENNSEEDETEQYYEMLSQMDKVKIIRYEGEFNYSSINNYGRKYAKGEYILLLNNDTEVISHDWIEELLMYAQREDVGAVGAKLLYEDDTIQHAGIVLGLGAHRTAGHIFYGIPKNNLGYMGMLCYAHNVSAVTGACLMVSTKKYDEVEGLSEDFTVALNDVDFCLKLREKGYLNVFSAYSELYHYESKSRGSDVEDEEKSRRYEREADHFKEKWKVVLEKGDPFYNVNFSLDSSDYKFIGKIK